MLVQTQMPRDENAVMVAGQLPPNIYQYRGDASFYAVCRVDLPSGKAHVSIRAFVGVFKPLAFANYNQADNFIQKYYLLHYLPAANLESLIAACGGVVENLI